MLQVPHHGPGDMNYVEKTNCLFYIFKIKKKVTIDTNQGVLSNDLPVLRSHVSLVSSLLGHCLVHANNTPNQIDQ